MQFFLSFSDLSFKTKKMTIFKKPARNRNNMRRSSSQLAHEISANTFLLYALYSHCSSYLIYELLALIVTLEAYHVTWVVHF